MATADIVDGWTSPGLYSAWTSGTPVNTPSQDPIQANFQFWQAANPGGTWPDYLKAIQADPMSPVLQKAQLASSGIYGSAPPSSAMSFAMASPQAGDPSATATATAPTTTATDDPVRDGVPMSVMQQLVQHYEGGGKY